MRETCISIVIGLLALSASRVAAQDPAAAVVERAVAPLSFESSDAVAPAMFSFREEEVAANSVLGQAGPGVGAATEADDWRINLIVYLWIPISMQGTAGVAGLEVPLDLTLGDVFDNFYPFAVSGRVEAWRRDTVGFIFDGMYVRLKSKGLDLPTMPPTPFDLTIQQGIIDLAAGWRVFKTPLTSHGDVPRLWVDLIGGLRWQYLEEKIDISVAPDLGGSESWVEPLVGGRVVCQLNKDLALMVRGDASGFGVGSASELTWNLVGGAAWRINDGFTMEFAYRLMSIDYDNGSTGLDQISLDMRLHGPWLGFVWVF